MHRITDWLGQVEAWLDEKGKPAWIVAMVLSFIVAWPIGLAILFYMIWSGRMASCKSRNSFSRRGRASMTGNAAFDEYREETMRRLEDEQTAFMSFMEKLRMAKDKAEFDQFMAERARPIDDAPVNA